MIASRVAVYTAVAPLEGRGLVGGERRKGGRAVGYRPTVLPPYRPSLHDSPARWVPPHFPAFPIRSGRHVAGHRLLKASFDVAARFAAVSDHVQPLAYEQVIG